MSLCLKFVFNCRLSLDLKHRPGSWHNPKYIFCIKFPSNNCLSMIIFLPSRLFWISVQSSYSCRYKDAWPMPSEMKKDYHIFCFIYNLSFYFILGRKMCEFPGEPKHGQLSPTKFYYNAGDKIHITCNEEYRPLGPVSLKCRHSGEWSGPMPICT